MAIHPEYVKAHRRLLVFGWGSLFIGVFGLMLPAIPGVVLVFFGISLLSLESIKLHQFSAKLRARYPLISDKLRTFETNFVKRLGVSTHTHEYISVTSRRNMPLQVLVEVSRCNSGVAVILHSATGTLETPVQNILASACRMRGLTVLRFDASHGLGEGGDTFTDFTTTSYEEDFEDVIAWARKQSWWVEPLTLVGHSLGALIASMYAQLHQSEVDKLVLLAPTVSGMEYIDAFNHSDPAGLAKWQETRLRTVQHPLSRESFGLSYGFVEDMMEYDMFPNAKNLTMKTFVIAGTDDITSPVAVCKKLVDVIGENSRLVIIPNMRHTPISKRELRSLAVSLLNLKEF